MRIGEIAFILVLLAGLVFLSFAGPRHRRWSLWLLLLLPLLGGLQALLEGWRWQLLPAQVLGGVLLLLSLSPPRPTQHRVLRFVAALLLWLPCAALPGLLPVFALPTPTGPHAVGLLTLLLSDTHRTSGPDGAFARLVSVEVFYPAASGSGTVEPLVPTPLLASRSSSAHLRQLVRLPMPWFLTTHHGLVRTHCRTGAAPASGGPFPLVLLSHGFLMDTRQNISLCEELASQGYVVASIGHPHETPFFQLPGGGLHLFSADDPVLKAQIREAMDLHWGDAPFMPRVRPVLEGRDTLAQLAVLRQLQHRAPTLLRSVQQRQADLAYVLGLLQRRTTAGPLNRLFDAERLGVVGMSLGGATALTFCSKDARCKAGVSLDGPALMPPEDRGPLAPFMFMHSDEFGLLSSLPMAFAKAPVCRLLLAGTLHANFIDRAREGGLGQLLGTYGPIDGPRALHIINAAALAFLDRHLRGQRAPLLDAMQAAFPEVSRYEHRP